jgi:hypothetical protein
VLLMFAEGTSKNLQGGSSGHEPMYMGRDW